MVKEERKTNRFSKTNEAEDKYAEIVTWTKRILNQEGPLFESIRILIRSSQIDLYDIVHDAYILAENYRAVQIPLLLSMTYIVRNYVSHHIYNELVVTQSIPRHEDTSRQHQFNSVASMLKGKISEDIVWSILSNYDHFSMVRDKLAKNITNITQNELETVCTLSDYLIWFQKGSWSEVNTKQEVPSFLHEQEDTV